jgi:hypothetical protein
VHQNHDYGYHADGEKGVWEGEEAQENYRLLHRKFATLSNASHLLGARGIRRNYGASWILTRQYAVGAGYWIWFGLLKWTRPVRHRLGVRKGAAGR